jgi:hypothetical protein
MVIPFLGIRAVKANTGEINNVRTVLKIYAYDNGNGNYVSCWLYDTENVLIFSENIFAGKVHVIPAIPGGRVEICVFPAQNFRLVSYKSEDGKMSQNEILSDRYDMDIVPGENWATFIFEEIPEKTAVFDIRSMKGEGTLIFKTEQFEKSFSKKDFYNGYVPTYENIKKVETSYLPAYRIFPHTGSYFSRIDYYQSRNKAYIVGRETVTMTVSADAHVTINGKGRIFSKNETVSFTIGFNYQAWQVEVKFLGELPHAAL